MIESFLDNSLIDRGGPVMWVLLGLSLFGFIVFIERTMYLHKNHIDADSFLAGIRNLVRTRRVIEALTVCQDTPGPVPAVIRAALLHEDTDENGIRQAIQGAALVELPLLERRIGAMATVARLAPLLGLLGTLIALIQGFSGLHHSIHPAFPPFGFLLGYIGEALISTATGLAVAIMAHAAHHFLFGRVKAILHDMEYCGHQMLDMLLHGQEEKGGGDGESG